MARIQTYTTDTAVASNDKFIGTDGAEGANNATKNFTVGDLTSYLITGDTNYIQLVNSGGVLANSVIYQDADGHVGIGVTGAPPNPVHRFEVFDSRDENETSDYSSVVTTHVNPPNYVGGAGGFLTRVSTDGGATYPGQIGLIPGTTSNDIVSNIRLAIHTNCNMDTSAPNNLAGTVTHDNTNAHWILNGALTDTTTHTLKVNGTSQFTDDITLSGDINETDSQLNIIVGELQDNMLQLNASSGSWSWRIGDQTSVTTIEGSTDTGNIDITSVGYVMARFNGITPTNSFIQLGGTGVGNRLDDYEEGTFTPILVVTGTDTAGFNVLGRYTKVGNLVTVTVMMDKSVNEYETCFLNQVTNLPFTLRNEPITGSKINGNLYHNRNTATGGDIWVEARESTSIMEFKNTGQILQLADDRFHILVAQITYEVE